MGVLQDLRDATLACRKAAVAGEKEGEHAAFLAMVLSDVYAVAKRQQREATDADAEPLMRTAVKQLTTLLDGDPEQAFAPLPESEYRTQTIAKRDLLAGILPERIEGEALATLIRSTAEGLDVEISMKSMGPIMTALKASHGGRIDGAKVKALLLSGV